jgi:hypothetical protein
MHSTSCTYLNALHYNVTEVVQLEIPISSPGVKISADAIKKKTTEGKREMESKS